MSHFPCLVSEFSRHCSSVGHDPALPLLGRVVSGLLPLSLIEKSLGFSRVGEDLTVENLSERFVGRFRKCLHFLCHQKVVFNLSTPRYVSPTVSSLNGGLQVLSCGDR